MKKRWSNNLNTDTNRQILERILYIFSLDDNLCTGTRLQITCLLTLFCINDILFLFRFLLKDELIVVQTEDDFKKILEDSKGKQNVILTNVKEIGMKGAEKT